MGSLAVTDEQAAHAPSEELAALSDLLMRFFRRQASHRLPAWEAEDLCQETLLAAWQALQTEGGTTGPVADLLAYTLGIARNKARDAWRAVKRERRWFVDAPPCPRSPTDGSVTAPLGPERLHRRDQRERLRRLLRRCPPIERRLLLLRYVAGLPHARACRQVGIDPVRGSRLLYRALRRLRESADAERPTGR